MGRNNVDKIMASSSDHVTNINKTLKNIKSNIMVDYIRPKAISVVIITNFVMVALDLQVIENYIKNIEKIIAEDVQTPRLPQSKFYLKIIGILYLMENTNTPITSEFIKAVIKSNHIFNDLLLISKPRVIKTSPKSNMTII